MKTNKKHIDNTQEWKTSFEKIGIESLKGFAKILLLDKYYDNTIFQQACSNGDLYFAEILIQKSRKLNIDLNAKDKCFGRTAFHLACGSNYPDIAKMLMKNSTDYDINLNATGEQKF